MYNQARLLHKQFQFIRQVTMSSHSSQSSEQRERDLAKNLSQKRMIARTQLVEIIKAINKTTSKMFQVLNELESLEKEANASEYIFSDDETEIAELDQEIRMNLDAMDIPLLQESQVTSNCRLKLKQLDDKINIKKKFEQNQILIQQESKNNQQQTQELARLQQEELHQKEIIAKTSHELALIREEIKNEEATKLKLQKELQQLQKLWQIRTGQILRFAEQIQAALDVLKSVGKKMYENRE